MGEKLREKALGAAGSDRRLETEMLKLAFEPDKTRPIEPEKEYEYPSSSGMPFTRYGMATPCVREAFNATSPFRDSVANNPRE